MRPPTASLHSPKLAAAARAARATILLAATLLHGCAAVNEYRVSRDAPHKDVVVLTVQLASELTPEEYRRIAERELAALVAAAAHDERREIPLYEVRFEFVVPRRTRPGVTRVATVHHRLSAEIGSTTQVILHAPASS